MLRLLHAVCILHIFIVKQVTGTEVTLGPSELVTLNSENSYNQTLKCTLSDGEKGRNDINLLYMSIFYHSLSSQSNNEEVWANILSNKFPVFGKDIPSSLGAVASGQLTNETAELTLTWNSTNVRCIDAGMFYCVVGYLDKEFKSATLNTTAETLTTLKVQRMTINLEMKKGSLNYGVNEATEDNPLRVDVGDVLEFKCIAEIGSSSNSPAIQWSSIWPFSGGETLEPDAQSGILTSSNDNGCGNTKTESFSYNVTQNEIGRKKKLGFACMFTYTEYPYLNQEVDVNSRAFYLMPEGSSSGGDGTSGASVQSAGTNTGAIAGGVVGGIVLVVLIVLLVYFLWYRRRGDGETYRTKEERGSENPNMVSNAAATDYAVPHKERRGYENDAMDEPHQDRSRRRDDRGRNDHSHKGRSNHAMDRDYDDYYNDGGDDSPTMTPHLNHMGGGDPHSSIGTGV